MTPEESARLDTRTDPLERYGPHWQQILDILTRAQTLTPDSQRPFLTDRTTDSTALDRARRKAPEPQRQWATNAGADIWWATRRLTATDHRWDAAIDLYRSAAEATVLADTLTTPTGRTLHDNTIAAYQRATGHQLKAAS